MQISQWYFASLDVEKTIAAMNPTMKITPAITGHFRFDCVMSGWTDLPEKEITHLAEFRIASLHQIVGAHPAELIESR